MNPNTALLISQLMDVAEQLNDLLAESDFPISSRVLAKSNELHDHLQIVRTALAKENVVGEIKSFRPYPKSQSMRG